MGAEIIDFDHILAQKAKRWQATHPMTPIDKARVSEIIEKAHKGGLLSKVRGILNRRP